MKAYLKNIAKTVTALIGALTMLGAALTDGKVTSAEWVPISIGVLTAVGVFFTENTKSTVDDN